MKILILDAGWPQTAYLIAELAAARFEVVRASPSPPDHIGLGHYCRHVQAPEDFNTAFLQSLLAQESADIVLPISEEILARLWELPAGITQRVYPSTTQYQRNVLLDRHEMYRMAETADVRVPAMLDLCDDDAALEEAASRFGYPMVLRGTAGLGGSQVRIVQHRFEAIKQLRDLRTVSPGIPFAQQLIEGQRCLFGALLAGGRIVSSFSQTTIEAFNPPTGPSIRVREIESERLNAYGERLFARLGWDGLACAEFIRDATGEFHFMEINPRPWAAISAAHECDVPLMRDFSAQLAGQTPPLRRRVSADREVILFPQYIATRLMTRRVQDLPQVLRCLAGGPWSKPRLMFHFARMLWWQV